MTTDQQARLIVQALCYDQIAEYAYGEDSGGNSVEIRWVGEEWQIIQIESGETSVYYEVGSFDRLVPSFEPEIIVSMYDNLSLADHYEETAQ